MPALDTDAECMTWRHRNDIENEARIPFAFGKSLNEQFVLI